MLAECVYSFVFYMYSIRICVYGQKKWKPGFEGEKMFCMRKSKRGRENISGERKKYNMRSKQFILLLFGICYSSCRLLPSVT